MAVVSQRKLQVLCLHGHAQTPTQFREKTGSVRGVVKGQAEFHFFEAPFVIPEGLSTESDKGAETSSTSVEWPPGTNTYFDMEARN